MSDKPPRSPLKLSSLRTNSTFVSARSTQFLRASASIDGETSTPLESLRQRNEHASNAATKIERHVPIWGITELPASRIEHVAGAPFAAREKIAFGALRQVM